MSKKSEPVTATFNAPEKAGLSSLGRFSYSRNIQFWVLQALGWGGLCVVTFLSLTVWYGTPNWSHVSHTLVQALLGAVIAWGLRYVYKAIWHKGWLYQFFIIALAVTLSSALWTALRMQAFLWLAEEYDIWRDFGGWYFGSFMVFLSWTALYYGARFYLMFRDERERRQLASLAAQQAQMQMLRYQLNPHFMFNTLNSISSLVTTGRKDEARQMITKLSQFMRQTLAHDTPILRPLGEELAALDHYLDIEQTRFSDRLKIEHLVEEEALSASVPAMLLQPLLENAIKHAIARSPDGGTIRLRARREADRLLLSVSDSGPGIGEDRAANNAADNGGVGLQNIAGRLRAHYGDRARLDFVPAQLGGFKVVLDLPFKAQESYVA